MTETEWLSSSGPEAMLTHISGCEVFCERKLRLFACARARTVWSLMTDERSRAAVEVAECLADGLASEADRVAAFEHATDAAGVEQYEDPEDEEVYMAAMAASYARNAVWDEAYVAAHSTAYALVIPDPIGEAVAVSQLRDIFGNPFSPLKLDRSWLTPKVADLAHRIYDDRDFQRMPELADALEQAGCKNPRLLAHCRESSPHVRGCWAVDLILDQK